MKHPLTELGERIAEHVRDEQTIVHELDAARLLEKSDPFDQWWAELTKRVDPRPPSKRPRHGVPEILMSLEQFLALPECSWTFPTATTIGKRWRCDQNSTMTGRLARASDWWVAEYAMKLPGDKVLIRWYRVVLIPNLENLEAIVVRDRGIRRERRERAARATESPPSP